MEFGDLRQACHDPPGPLAFARVQVALGRLFARDPLGASDRALPYANAQLARWPDEARWIEFGDGTDPRLIPRDPRQLGLARVLVFSSPRGALDRQGHARQEHLIEAVVSGATGPLELARLELDLTGNDPLLRKLLGARSIQRMNAIVLDGTREGPLLGSLAATRFWRTIERIELRDITFASFRIQDRMTHTKLAERFPALEELVLAPDAVKPEREALESDAARVTLEEAHALIARAELEGAWAVEVEQTRCDEQALAALRESELPYVHVRRGRGY